MDQIELILNALKLASKYHGNQIDKAGMPYIEHCIRVGARAGLKAETREDFYILTTIGILHDILEDTELTLDELREAISNEKVVNAVSLLTRNKEKTYVDYINQLAVDKLSVIVKLADIEDHLIEREGYELPTSLRERYEKAWKLLLKQLIKCEMKESTLKKKEE